MVAHIVATSTYGFSVTVVDLMVIIQSTQHWMKVKSFKNNCSGRA